MKFNWNVLQISTYRLTESDFRLDVTLSRWATMRSDFMHKSASTWWVNGIYAAASVRQFLIYSTLVYLLIIIFTLRMVPLWALIYRCRWGCRDVEYHWI